MNDPDVCRRCALKNPTCCRHASGEERFCFPLPEAEYQALRAFGVPESAFAEEPNAAAFCTHLARLFPGAPVEAAFPVHGTHRRLATPNSACTLLTPQGCSLPRTVRPLFCRTYPLWSIHGRLTAFENPNCLAVCEAAAPMQLCRLMGTDPQRVRAHVHALRGMLFAEE